LRSSLVAEKRSCAVLCALSALVLSRSDLRAQQDPEGNAHQKAAIKRSVDAALALEAQHSCPLVHSGLKLASFVPKHIVKLPPGVAATTFCEDRQGQGSTDYVWMIDLGNVVGLSPSQVGSNGLTHMNMSTPELNDLMIAGLLFAEMGHQNLRTRLDKDENALPDPAGTPNQQTGPENDKSRNESEVEVADRMIWYIDWLLACAEGPNPAIELNQADRDQLAKYKEAAKNQKVHYGG
jgi:hypothetical protein